MLTREFDVVFYYGDPEERNSLYQLKQWIQPLKRLSKHCTVAVVTANLKASKIVIENQLPSFNYEDMEQSLSFVNELRPRVIFYPNQFFRNFPIWGYLGAVHIFVSHGESDKTYMSQNSLQFFDYVYTAGSVAKMRIREHVPGFAEMRCISIGRPQLLDEVEPVPNYFHKDDQRKTILYAPTWEGGLPQNRYGSIQSHGLAIVRSILSKGDKYQLIFKPHPFTGSIFPEAREVLNQIISEVREAGNGHVFDDSPFGWQPKVADLMITDVSAVAYDWLATGKPILITKPIAETAEIYADGILGAVDLVEYSASSEICSRIEVSFQDKGSQAFFSHWSSKYYESAVFEPSGEERFIYETKKILSARSRAIEKTPLVKVNAPSQRFKFRRTILKMLSPDFKMRILNLLSNILNGKMKQAEVVALQLSVSPITKALITEISKRGRTLLLVGTIDNAFKAFLIALKDKKLRKNLTVRFAPSAQEVVATIKWQNLNEVFYLVHHANNHFGVRLNGIRHILFRPESQPGFRVDHNLIAYNEIQTSNKDLKRSIELKVIRPEGWNITLV